MRSDESEMPFAIKYLLVLGAQGPIWLCGGLIWAGFMIALGSHPSNALVGGFVWGLFMWLVCGNLLAVGAVWRRSAEFSAPDRAAFRVVLDRTCPRLLMKVLAESADDVVLGPRWTLIRFRLQEVRVVFDGEVATVSGPALSFGTIRRRLARALDEPQDDELGS